MKKTSIISAVIAISILFLLVLTRPAEAYIVGLSILDKEVSIGEETVLEVGIEIEEGEVFDIQNFKLILQGPEKIECVFDVNASIISGCPGMSINQTESAPYHYGYGFEKGRLFYNITINTATYIPGIYKTEFSVIADGILKKKGEKITIKGEGDIEGCSLRAEKGVLRIDEKNFGTKNKLSFFVPLKKAVSGSGSLTSQSKKERFYYDFIIIDVLENNKDRMILSVNGEYRTDNIKKNQDSTIVYDKKKKTVDMVSEDFSADKMKVDFVYGC